jgi:hypothetical protein
VFPIVDAEVASDVSAVLPPGQRHAGAFCSDAFKAAPLRRCSTLTTTPATPPCMGCRVGWSRFDAGVGLPGARYAEAIRLALLRRL